MPNYVRYGNPWVNSLTPPAITAAFLTALENVLTQPSGGTETGKYFLTSSSYVNAASMGAYVPSISRNATPVSVVIDEADLAHTGCGAASTDHVGSNGFHVFTTTSGVRPDANVGGSYTINY